MQDSRTKDCGHNLCPSAASPVPATEPPLLPPLPAQTAAAGPRARWPDQPYRATPCNQHIWHAALRSNPKGCCLLDARKRKRPWPSHTSHRSISPATPAPAPPRLPPRSQRTHHSHPHIQQAEHTRTPCCWQHMLRWAVPYRHAMAALKQPLCRTSDSAGCWWPTPLLLTGRC